MVKFIITNNSILPEDIAFLKGKVRIIEDTEISEDLFETDNVLIDKLGALEDAGFIKIIRQYNDIQNASDIIACTDRVEMLRGVPTSLRVHILDHIWDFSETELLGPTAIMRHLLSLKRAIRINRKNWSIILNSWLSRAEDVDEISEIIEISEIEGTKKNT